MAEIRVIPHAGDRVETGPVQFGDDWPGTFIRGDAAGWYGFLLGRLLEDYDLDPTFKLNLPALVRALNGCNLRLRVEAEGTPPTVE